MRHKHRLIIWVALINVFAISAAADSGAMLCQLHHGFGDQSVTRIRNCVISDDEGAPSYAAPALPMLSSNAEELTIMNLSGGEDSSSFCERHSSGCLAIGAAVVTGASLYAVEKEHTKDVAGCFVNGGYC
ncbi:MAG: hypothetical protein OES26_15590 [Gammaproteobacteria bacterium]|nr:hypothetical protein [Gammaproteobacteria bacterium]